MNDRFVGVFAEKWDFHLNQILSACGCDEVLTRDLRNFLAVGLQGNALNFYMELCPEEETLGDWWRLRQALNGQYDSVT